MLKSIAIYGGTFDPVHNGHTKAALALEKIFSFDEIRFLPCKQPVLKNAANASSQHRLAMLKLALTGFPKAIIDDREIKRTGPSYMVDTLASMHTECPKASLSLVIGMDAFNDLPQWHLWEALFDFAHIIVINRPNVLLNPNPNLEKIITLRQTTTIDALKAKPCGLLYFQQLAETPISSTVIRQRMQQGKSVASMLDIHVLDYIQTQKIYR